MLVTRGSLLGGRRARIFKKRKKESQPLFISSHQMIWAGKCLVFRLEYVMLLVIHLIYCNNICNLQGSLTYLSLKSKGEKIRKMECMNFLAGYILELRIWIWVWLPIMTYLYKKVWIIDGIIQELRWTFQMSLCQYEFSHATLGRKLGH